MSAPAPWRRPVETTASACARYSATGKSCSTAAQIAVPRAGRAAGRLRIRRSRRLFDRDLVGATSAMTSRNPSRMDFQEQRKIAATGV